MTLAQPFELEFRKSKYGRSGPTEPSSQKFLFFVTAYRAISPIRPALIKKSGSSQRESATDMCAKAPAIISTNRCYAQSPANARKKRVARITSRSLWRTLLDLGHETNLIRCEHTGSVFHR